MGFLAVAILMVLAYTFGFLNGGRCGWKMGTLNAVAEYDAVMRLPKGEKPDGGY